MSESSETLVENPVTQGELLDPTTEPIGKLPVKLVDQLPGEVPILLSPQRPVFPGMMTAIPLHTPEQEQALREASPFVGMVSYRPTGRTKGQPVPVDSLYHVGCVGRPVQPVKMSDEGPGIAVGGFRRMRIARYHERDGVLFAQVEYPDDVIQDKRLVKALFQQLRTSYKELAKIGDQVPEELIPLLDKISDPAALADVVGANLGDGAAKQNILAEFVVDNRLHLALTMLEEQLDLVRLGAKIQDGIRTKMEEQHKRHYLHEQMTAIRKELGEEVDQKQLDRDTYEDKIVAAQMPYQAEERAYKELDRLTLLSPEAAEYHVIRNYLDWLVELPWSVESDDQLDLRRSRKILDEDHHGLDEVKQRIVEFLAVRKLKQDRGGAILCLVGPPGVGKTSLGRSLARAMGREYVRVSLGGMRDEAEIKGHRRTYVGAMPGKLIQNLKRAGTRNPVFVLDEIDKLGSDWRGDPSSAMLEVLDPEQNANFEDLYLDTPFDLSQVFFIATANVPSQIPPALRDRMEIINLSGYIPAEKKAIGRKYLLPRQLEANGLTRRHLKIPAKAMAEIIDGYTREAGVRELERQIGRICRKVAAGVAELDDGEQADVVKITPEDLPDYLGARRHFHDVVSRRKVPGVVNGLAWTPVGGEVLFIEADNLPGHGKLMLTGKLGDVMTESARIALSVVKARAERFGIDPAVFEGRDIHLHVPAGAVPKDGPSAGVAMTVALLSLLWGGKGRAAKARTAMTGEITLRGAVLPVGGIKDKVIGAKRAGVKTVILPAANEPDVLEIEAPVIRGLTFIYVDTIEEAVEAALGVELSRAA